MAPKTYTLTFDSQGGSEVTSQTVVEGQTRSRPAQNPTKTNWTFDNWYTST
ncbi:InlB B-repeat-containing protein [bacterium]|nr:InlB B-repeat-containing protein [bacterium]